MVYLLNCVHSCVNTRVPVYLCLNRLPVSGNTRVKLLSRFLTAASRAHMVLGLSDTVKMDLHFLPLMMHPGRGGSAGMGRTRGNMLATESKRDHKTVLWWIHGIFSMLYLHNHSVPGLMSSSFAGPPSGWPTIVHCEENSNYDIIRAETSTYKVEDPEGDSRRNSAGAARRDIAAE